MKKSIDDSLKEFWGTSRWDELGEVPKNHQSMPHSAHNREFLIGKYTTQFPEEHPVEIERVRL
jgi:hypothetical protein